MRADGLDLPAAFVHRLIAAPADVDDYGHVNNAVYLRWLDATAWAHAAALGVTLQDCLTLRRGMIFWRSQMHYLAAAHAGDALTVATWIVFSDGRLRVDRRFQVLRPADGRTLLRALVHYVCADLDSGKPRRMPPVFSERYRPPPALVPLLAAEPHRSFAPGVEARAEAAGLKDIS
ncbi:MAG: acyl-CoA thioesterase [Gammaproteobacteria bacterium]|nr:acyl-CoA thioesterase [Gammaproteobacteria bacterium]